MTLEDKQADMRERMRVRREVHMTTGTKTPSVELASLRRFFFGAPVPPLVGASGRDILPESKEPETDATDMGEALDLTDPVHDIEAERARDILATVCPPPHPVAVVDEKLISFVINSSKE